MATSTVTATLNAFPNGKDVTLRRAWYFGTMTVGAGTYETNGLPFTITDPQYTSKDLPSLGSAWSVSSGVQYELDLVHQTLRIFMGGGSSSTGPGVELSNGATVPSIVTGDTISFEVGTPGTD